MHHYFPDVATGLDIIEAKGFPSILLQYIN